MKLEGVFSALVTSFTDMNNINESEYRKLIQFQMKNGVSGLVPCGTTGESPTLSYKEKMILIKIAIEEANGKIPVIAGSGSYNTRETIETTKRVATLGADAALVVTPYYNKPDQQGLFLHYEAIAKACPEIDLVIYNVPSRTNVNISPQTVYNLVKSYENIRTIKEASGNLSQVIELHRLCGENLSILSGEDGLVLPYIASGASGVISVTSNILPRLFTELVSKALANDFKSALEIQEKCLPLINSLFCETNPIPIKYALDKMQFDTKNIRLPLHELSKKYRGELEQELLNMGLI